MKHIISGTNRPGSRTRQVAEIVRAIYQDLGEEVEIIDLAQLPMQTLTGNEYGGALPQVMLEVMEKINNSEGLIVIAPEYNGSMPGALKYFIDHWKYPDTFEHRPVCFIGLGGLFGGLRPVEHLQQVFGYRNSYVFPQRIFLINIWQQLKNGAIQDPVLNSLMQTQARDFSRFVKALEGQGLDANAILKVKAQAAAAKV